MHMKENIHTDLELKEHIIGGVSPA